MEENQVHESITYERVDKEKSKGQLFKEKNGYSKTLKRLSTDKGLTIEDYKRIRKQRKRDEKAVQDAKHDKAKAGRSSKSNPLKAKK